MREPAVHRPYAAVPRAAARPRPLLRTMLGDELRRTRLEQRRTLADVARSARVSMQYLSELERGRKEASSEVLAAVCDALGLDLLDLLAAAGRKALRDAAATQVVRLGRVGFGPPGLDSAAAPGGLADAHGDGGAEASLVLADNSPGPAAQRRWSPLPAGPPRDVRMPRPADVTCLLAA